jgi:molybdenum cofactor guanylyltransferase
MKSNHTVAHVAGAILVGGKSRRMGRDKASIEVAGQTLLERAFKAVSEVTNEVFICGAVSSAGALFGAKIIEDAKGDAGPMGGIVAALRASSSPHCLVVACDMPFLNVTLLEYLIDLAPTADLVVPEIDGITHQMHAVYAKSCLPHLEALLASGDYRMHALFPLVRTRYVGRNGIERFDREHRSLMNLNTPEDLAAAERILAARSAQPES